MTRPLNILVLDDDAENADSLAELFAMDDHKVIVAYNGQEAIEAFSLNRVDVGFFDVMMPGKNGVDSFIEIKQTHPDAKVYFMTGYSADDLLKQAIDNGALGVFGKPMDLPKVLRVLDEAAA
ncbi:MAG: response regulator [Rhizobiales bacterium]|nr:response regulator [Hyphomicrobiales bacterium]